MFTRDRHLNIFEHYQSAGTLPIENNVSRGFAIVLESYPLIFDRFIDYVNTKCSLQGSTMTVPKPERTEDFDVGFQRSIKQISESYSELSSVIGLTLTTTMKGDESCSSSEANSDLITDITVVVGDTAIIIEVKRTDENASVQCQHQIVSLTNALAKDGKSFELDSILLDGTWDEIIDLLQKSAELIQENDRGILSQYLQHLNFRYQQWFPTRKLSEIDFSEENASLVEKRISLLAKNCCDDPDEAKNQWGGYTMPTDKPYAGAVLITANYGEKALDVKIWVADTKSQGRQYFDTLKDDLSWVYESQLGVGNQSFDIVVVPYLRFAHFQSTIFNAPLVYSYYNENFGADKQRWYELWKAVSYEWDRDDWPSLMELLTKTYKGIVDSEDVCQKFISNFEETKRTYVHVSLGFEVTVPIPYSVVVQKERESDVHLKSSDVLAVLLESIKAKMLHRVE